MKEYIVQAKDNYDFWDLVIYQDGKKLKELIRCKDCKHWLPHTQFGYDADYDEYHNYCERHLPDDTFYAFIKEAEDYCSWAERRNDETD